MKISLRVLWVLICLFSTEIFAQNAPITTAGTRSSTGSTITVEIAATDFTNIGSCNLKLVYDPAIATATAVATSHLLAGNVSSNLTVPGEIYLGWYTFPAMTLPDNTVIFNIDFAKAGDGTSPVTWVDDGSSCQYADGSFYNLNDIPASNYYVNGSLTFNNASGIADSEDNSHEKSFSNPLQLISYPNPFTDQATFTFLLPERGRVVLEFRNLLGQSIEVLADQELPSGYHSINIRPKYTGPGLFMAVLSLKTNNKLVISKSKIIRN